MGSSNMSHPSRLTRRRGSAVRIAPQDDGSHLASRRNNLLPLLAQPLDAERDDVADIEKARRLHARADAGRRARRDDVAGQQGKERRDVRNALRYGEDHGRGRPGLAALAIDVEPHRELLHVGNFVPGGEPRADRAKRVVRLALGPLPAALLLEIAFRDIVADAVAGDVIERVSLGNVFGAGTDNGGDFDFPVEFLGFARFFDRIVRTAQGGVGLQEKDRLGRNRVSGLLGVIDIVQADGDEFRNAGHRRAESRLAVDGGKRGRIERREFCERCRRIGFAVEVLHVGRKVAQLAGFIDQAGLFRTLGPITNKLHFSSLPCGFAYLGRFLEQRGGKFNCRLPVGAALQVFILRVGRQVQAKATNLKASPSRLRCPALKCPPITRVGVSAKRENNSRRVTTDWAGSESAVDDQSRCAIWQGWWATSPVSRPCSPSDLMWILMCPGLWPGVGIRVISSVSPWSSATSAALPASAMGFTESLNTAM